jgi:hypothetical protein
MDEQHDNSSAAGGSTPLPKSLFADESRPPAGQQAHQALDRLVARPKSRLKPILMAVVLPVAILLVGIAVIAWLAQYLPSRGRPVPAQVAVAGTVIFDKTDSVPKAANQYIPELELGQDGHYDFSFTNTSATEMELGVARTSCGCSSVAVCAFENEAQKQAYQSAPDATPLTWKSVEVDPALRKKVMIPAQASGVMRVSWKGKAEPEQLRLLIDVWVRAPGHELKGMSFTAWAMFNHPVRFDQQKIDLGALGPKEQRVASFYCWSPTRDFQVKAISEEKCFQVETVPLSFTECASLEKKLEDYKIITRIKSAYRVNVTLMEEAEGQQLDLGLIMKPVPLVITSNGDKVEVPLPMVRATVQGDVTLGGSEKEGKIDFNFFSAKKGKTKKVTLFAPKDAKLSFVECQPALLDMEAELSAVKTVGDKTQWEMQVTAKPNRDPGPLPDNGVVVLRCELPATASSPAATRLVRIHVVGTASSLP